MTIHEAWLQHRNLGMTAGRGGGGGACFARPKRRGRSRARRTFQALINISFPKIIGEREREGKHFRTYHISLTYPNL